MPKNIQLEEKKHRLAIEYKYNGKNNLEITQIIRNITGEQISQYTINSWFITNGRLHNSYLKYVDKQNDSLVKKAQQDLRGLATKAVKVVKDTMDEFIFCKLRCPKCKEESKFEIKIPTKDKLSASKEVLDRALGVIDTKPTNTYIHNELTVNQIDERTRAIEKEIKTVEGSTIEEDGGGDGEKTGT